MSEAQPLYARLKDHILARIREGTLAPGARVSSENELVESFGVSRMTANRALRELFAEGHVARVPGVGTFVSKPVARGSLMELRDIAEEIAARGHQHSSRLVSRAEVNAAPQQVEDFELKGAQRLFHIAIVHSENGTPVQLEDRYVNPFVVPHFLAQDFSQRTPTAYLVATVPVDELEHTVEAVMPDQRQRALLGIGAEEPCLALRRRSWSRGHVVTSAALIYPASRYALYSRHKTTTHGAQIPRSLE